MGVSEILEKKTYQILLRQIDVRTWGVAVWHQDFLNVDLNIQQKSASDSESTTLFIIHSLKCSDFTIPGYAHLCMHYEFPSINC